jgi:hypothetical protein
MTSPFFYRAMRATFPYTVACDNYVFRTNTNGSPAMLAAIIRVVREDDEKSGEKKHKRRFYRIVIPGGGGIVS